MKSLGYIASVLWALLVAGAAVVSAQGSVDPKADSIAINEIKARMAHIHRHRPVVALVLCGGGAKGAAHVGVIRYLEEIDMPVDMVLGTSMGGLVGGIYALGYDAAALDSVIKNIDWKVALSDKIPRNYVSYSDVKYKEKYLLSFPFYYSKRDRKYDSEDELAVVSSQDKSRLSFGAVDGAPADAIRSGLVSSLPAGYIFGQNVNNLISSLTVGYQDSLDFNNLPIPFACVATDMVSTKAKNWHNGKINLAMRSTMSIPGMFAPVRTDGMVLADGGMRNNYPTDLARKMGADIIIGVDLSDSKKTYEDINNLGDIISQGVDMLGRESYERNVHIADINIKPHLKEYNMMSFSTEAIDTIVNRGYEAAKAKANILKYLKSRIGDYGKTIASSPAVNIINSSVEVSGVRISGVSAREAEYLMGKIHISPGDRVNSRVIDDAVAKIFATRAFDYVTYELQGSGEPYVLEIQCKKGPIHNFGVSARFDTEEIVSVLVNLGLNTRRLSGSKYDFALRVSANPGLDFHYTYDAPKVPTFNFTSKFRWMTKSDFLGMNGDGSKFKIDYFKAVQEAFISNIHWKKVDLKGGIRNEYYYVTNFLSDNGYNVNGGRGADYLSLFADLNVDTFDNAYFPTKGVMAKADYDWMFASAPGKAKNVHTASVMVRGSIPVSRNFNILPYIAGRAVLGEYGDIPAMRYNLIGGSMPGRYADHQIPFIGVNTAMFMDRYLGVGRLDLRYRFSKNNYVSLIGNYAVTCRDFQPSSTFSEGFGVGAEYSYNSIIGPLTINLHWSSFTKKVGMYINIGLYF